MFLFFRTTNKPPYFVDLYRFDSSSTRIMCRTGGIYLVYLQFVTAHHFFAARRAYDLDSSDRIGSRRAGPYQANRIAKSSGIADRLRLPSQDSRLNRQRTSFTKQTLRDRCRFSANFRSPSLSNETRLAQISPNFYSS